MKKKLYTLTAALALFAASANAGGLMTNTNYHIAFDRMMARGATFDIDAAYSNPAGLAWGYDGLQLSLNFQKPWQNRNIEAYVPGYPTLSKEYVGKASAPIVPALFGSYKKDRWAVSAMIGIVGSGGFVEYDDGVPMFNVPVTAMLESRGLKPGSYILDTEMKGKQYIYGGQVNFTYKITDFLSAAVGMRANYYDGYYEGHVTADMLLVKPLDLQLDCKQRGWGFAPIVSLDFHKGPITVAARYEFRTKINTTNDTKTLSFSTMGNTTDIAAMANQAGAIYGYELGNTMVANALSQQVGAMGQKIKGYLPEEKTRYDMPSLLSVAVGYEITPKLRATAEYHFFDDRHAKMANDRQKELTHGTHEFLLGVEYDINDKFTVSLGGQRTDYGLSDTYQSNTSFACDSYSFGLGGAVKLTEKIRLNVGYFMSIYSDYTKSTSTGYYGTEIYSRTNYVGGIGIDYKF